MTRIMRRWAGAVRTADRDTYIAYVAETGLAGYRSTPGNLDAWVMYRDRGDDTSEIVTLSLWESREAIVAFAGDDIETARFYPEDDAYLVERDLVVTHSTVVD